jgi:hypothetical protein
MTDAPMRVGGAAHVTMPGLSPAARGSLAGSAKLAEADIAVIRRRLARGETCVGIAACYRVHKSTIHRVKCRETWRHVA